MKKFLLAILAITLMVVSAFGLFACNDGEEGEGALPNSGLVLTKYNGEDFYTVTGYDEESTAKTLTIPNKAEDGIAIKKIAEGAFDGCSYEEIVISSSVEEIGAGAFKNAVNLKKITLPFVGKYFNADAYPNQTPEGDSEPIDGDYSTVKAVNEQRSFGYIFATEIYEGGVLTESTLGEYFIPATLQTVVIAPKADYEIPMQAFDSLIKINKFEFSEKVVGIGQGAFKNAIFYNLEIPSSVANIYDGAFEGAEIRQSLTFKENSSLTKLNAKVFFDAKIKEIVIPNGVTTISEECFGATVTTTNNVDTSTSILEKVTLPQTLEKIERSAFKNCFNLKTVDVTNVASASVELSDYAFLNCKKLVADSIKGIFSNTIENAFIGTKNA